MNKTLSKSFMYRAKLKNNFNKSPTEENHLLYKKQRNYCSNLRIKVKKEYYNSLDINIFKDNKSFWTNVRPLFSDKMTGRHNDISLIENDQVITETKIVADKLNNYFLDAIVNLGIIPHSSTLNTESAEEIGSINPTQIDKIIEKYKDHPSILNIKEHVKIKETFSFSKPTIENVGKILLSLDCKKNNSRKRYSIKGSSCNKVSYNGIYYWNLSS